jgi:ankyrin repeat protein
MSKQDTDTLHGQPRRFLLLLRASCVLVLMSAPLCHSADPQIAPFENLPSRHLSELVEAAQSNHAQRLSSLLTNVTDINHCLMRKGYVYAATPLIAASENGHLAAVEILLRHGAAVDIQATAGFIGSGTALLAAALHGRSEVVQRLLVAKANPNAAMAGRMGGETALHKAAGGGHLEVARMLLRAGADPNAHTANSGMSCRLPLNWAASGGHTNLIALLLQAGALIDGHSAGSTHMGPAPLMEAAVVGRVNAVQYLIRAGASVKGIDDSSPSPLHFAAAAGHVSVIEALLAGGADPNAGVARGEMSGWTPLHFAASKGMLAAARRLIEAGANPNSSPNGVTPSLVAQAAHHEELRLYLSQNAPTSTARVPPGAALPLELELINIGTNR